MLALPGWINPLLPKLLFAFGYLAFAIWLIKDDAGHERRPAWKNLVLLTWFFNPYVWVEIPYYGHFDILVGLCCVAAVAARARRRDVLSGIGLGTGSLIKFMPTVLLPFLILDGQKFRFRLLAVGLGVIAAGMLASFLIWGVSTFQPLLFAAGRASQHLSIFRFLNGAHSPLLLFNIEENADVLAGPLMLVALCGHGTGAGRTR